MNTTYHTIDGATFTATDPTDLMTQLRAEVMGKLRPSGARLQPGMQGLQ